VLLASDEECIHKAGRHLRTLYWQEGWQVLYLPIPDFGVPAKEDLERGVQSTIEQARAGQHIAIHCSAGIGRTGLFTACLAKYVLGLSGEEAIAWIRHYIPGAIETPIQRQLVMGNDAS
jgi:protein-tyrosine phosphatase